ncbi:chromosome segregation protein SMC [Geobacter sp. SVR]|uniref:chromosome segregation protein SMC n=1 Tax=Geobacter sp. SVR TaxID=2495594 RepID=UPI00143F039F|nr:chromosome segregation protein SMC [Geobacter sp. SVR]BCS56047.1 chromosome partition protein Smc [Geobacter sp. SVR]GCF84810.1 chromosome partition protein Smc [Geobacter sp. SVR]
MKIKRLEISGFKSFADKIVLDFQQGVTGVVGPNGCGKSNIVDAIRWCMGEQSAKNLRGKAMEDVIFAGSETRKALGMAEVSLVFSTEDGRAPAKYLEYAEIQLTRRLYRDGESDYLINKTPCRLMDITELFMDTGVGTRAYSIIEQGKIGQILHSRPEERRFLIEEAAGVTKFKSRKHLALKKIEATRLNLARLADVLGEIRRQLGSLQRQARKAEKFREYRDELREIELLFTAREYRETQRMRAEAERELSALNQRIREVFVASAVGESQLEEGRLALVEAEKRLNAAQEDIYRIKSEFSTAESGLEFQCKELTGLTGRLVRLEAEAGELDARLAECIEQRNLLEVRRDASTTESAGLQAELRQAEEALAGQQQAEEESNRLLEGRRKELFAAMSESAQFKSRYEQAVKRLASLSERLERHSREGIQQAERLEDARRRAVDVDRNLEQVRQEQEELRVEQAALLKREEELKARLPVVEKEWQTRRDELNRSASRLHSLRELEAKLAGYGQGVKNLMKSAELKPRFRGFLADAVVAPAELEAPLEAALADRLQCVLCDGDDDAMAALEFLKRSSGGRVGLALPLEFAAPPVAPPDGAHALEGLVQVSGPHQGLIRRMLASVLLVDGIAQAIALARRHPEFSFVTREGDLVSQGGVISGGSADQVQQGLIHKKREIRELEERVAVLEQEVSSLGSEREQVRRQAQEVAEHLKEIGKQVHQGELRLAGLAKDRQQATDEISRIEERLAVQAMETETLHEERDALEVERKLCLARLEETGGFSQELEQEVARLKEALDVGRSQLAAGREQVSALRVRVATLREQHEAHQRGIADLERQTQELTRRMTGDREEIARGAGERTQLEAAIAAGTERVEELILRQSKAARQLEVVRADYETAGAAMAATEARVKQAREDSDGVRQTQADLNLRFSTLNMQAEHLERGLLEKSRITMDEALARLAEVEFDEAARRGRQVELQRLLDEIGEVNLMAIEECAGMEERFTFLTSQKEDLEESLRGLQQAIQRINRTTRQRFLETYNLVNAKFQEVFPRLFCGGRAELRLTNEEDLLETGIDIIVQPPGKKLQNVTLLSGGEKALTAVALIFAIFLIKPTPFCLLDEVDAPLDDANIGRFNDMVREMSAISQFIIITHNKATMQVADTLYGITMESPGASRVVSVRLH